MPKDVVAVCNNTTSADNDAIINHMINGCSDVWVTGDRVTLQRCYK